MPFKPDPIQPNFEELRGVISTSKTTIEDKNLNQVLTGLLDKLKRFQKLTLADIADINNILEAEDTTIINITNLLQLATFLTVADETLNFPAARRLLAGSNVTFDDTVAGQRTVNATSGLLPVGTVFSTYVNVNPGALLGYGVWLLMATGVKAPGTDITFTVY